MASASLPAGAQASKFLALRRISSALSARAATNVPRVNRTTYRRFMKSSLSLAGDGSGCPGKNTQRPARMQPIWRGGRVRIFAVEAARLLGEARLLGDAGLLFTAVQNLELGTARRGKTQAGRGSGARPVRCRFRNGAMVPGNPPVRRAGTTRPR